MNVFKPVVVAAAIAALLPMPGSASVVITVAMPAHIVVGQTATITASVDSDQINLLAETCFNHALGSATMRRYETKTHSDLVLTVRGHIPGTCTLTFHSPRAQNTTVSVAVVSK